MEGEHYRLIGERGWELLVASFGGGPAIRRQVIEVGRTKELMVEIYPLLINVRLQLFGYYFCHLLIVASMTDGHAGFGWAGSATSYQQVGLGQRARPPSCRCEVRCCGLGAVTN